PAVKFAAIANWAAQGMFPVAFMCQQLEVSRSGYYAWRGSDLSDRERSDLRLIALIQAAWDRLRGNPGVRRMRAELAARGERVSHKRVWRLLRAAGLQGRHRRAFNLTSPTLRRWLRVAAVRGCAVREEGAYCLGRSRSPGRDSPGPAGRGCGPRRLGANRRRSGVAAAGC